MVVGIQVEACPWISWAPHPAAQPAWQCRCCEFWISSYRLREPSQNSSSPIYMFETNLHRKPYLIFSFAILSVRTPPACPGLTLSLETASPPPPSPESYSPSPKTHLRLQLANWLLEILADILLLPAHCIGFFSNIFTGYCKTSIEKSAKIFTQLK